jgi:hypothetical protein
MKYALTLLLPFFFLSTPAFSVGTVVITSRTPIHGTIKGTGNRREVVGEKIIVTATGDASDGSFPSTGTPVQLNGFLIRVVTNPGATAPTANYDVVINDENSIDVAQATLANRHTSNTEEVYPVPTSAASPPFVQGDHNIVITNSSVNSAIIVFTLYVHYGV